MKKILSMLLTIAMILSLAAMTVVAYDYDNALIFGAETYQVSAGETFSVPAYYISTVSPSEDTVAGMLQVNLDFTDSEVKISSVDSGLCKIATTNYTETTLDYFTDAELTCNNAQPLFTLNLIAPETPGTYTIEFHEYCEVYDTNYDWIDADFGKATITVTEAASTNTSVEVVTGGAASGDYSANAYTVTDTLAQFSLFAKAANATEYGIILGTEEFTAENIKEKNVWILAADGANDEGIFAVTAFEEKTADASFTKLTSANVWACAYATNADGEYVISDIIKY